MTGIRGILPTTNSLYRIDRDLSRTIARLSSGSRITSAADDAAGLAIATGLSTQARGLRVAVRGINQLSSMATVADGALGEVTNQLHRLRDRTVQAGSPVTDRAAIATEASQILAGITHALGTRYNGMSIFDGQPGTATPYAPAVPEVPAAPATAVTVTGSVDLTPAPVDPLNPLAQPVPVATLTDGAMQVSINGVTTAVDLGTGDIMDAADATGRLTQALTDAGVNAVSVNVSNGRLVLTGLDGSDATLQVTGAAASTLGISTDETDPQPATTTAGTDAVEYQPYVPEHLATPNEALHLQTSADGGATMRSVTIDRLTLDELNLTNWSLDAPDALERLDGALTTTLGVRASLGAAVNGNDHAVAAMTVAAGNAEASASTISDADMGDELIRFSLLQTRRDTAVAVQQMATQAARERVTAIYSMAAIGSPSHSQYA